MPECKELSLPSTQGNYSPCQGGPHWASSAAKRAPVLGWHAYIDNLSFLPPARLVPAKANFPARTWNWGIFSNYYIRIELQIDSVSRFCLFYLSSGFAKLPILLWRSHEGHYWAYSSLYFGRPWKQFGASMRCSLLSSSVRWHQSTIMNRPEKLLNLNHRISTTLWGSCSRYDISTLRDSSSLFLKVYVSL